MKIAGPGWRFITLGSGVALIGAGLSVKAPFFYTGYLLEVLGAGFGLFSAYFFRDPERPLPADDKIYSPGDGTVIGVDKEGPGEITTLRIFLSVFDVHVQRAPCAGTVDWVRYQPGTFRAAMKGEAKLNERSIMRLSPEGGREPLVVEQIAGYLARRIETWVKAGDALKAGERYGMIHFGSQASVHFPAGAKCTVKFGDTVTAGVTAIGEWVGHG